MFRDSSCLLGRVVGPLKNRLGLKNSSKVVSATRSFCWSTEISPKEVAQRVNAREDVYVVDVRNDYEMKKDDLPLKRVYNIPLRCFFDAAAVKKDQVESVRDILPYVLWKQDAEIITVCQDGYKAKLVATLLAEYGWKKIFDMAGGVDKFAIEVLGHRKPEPSCKSCKSDGG